MDRYTISDLEKLTGIRAGTIRIWEQQHRIIRPHRTDTNGRWYDSYGLRRFLNISILYRKGIKISITASFNGLVDVAERWNHDFLVTGALTRLPFDGPEDYLKHSSNAFSDKKILVSGVLARYAGKDSPENVIPFDSPADLEIYI